MGTDTGVDSGGGIGSAGKDDDDEVSYRRCGARDATRGARDITRGRDCRPCLEVAMTSGDADELVWTGLGPRP